MASGRGGGGGDGAAAGTAHIRARVNIENSLVGIVVDIWAMVSAVKALMPARVRWLRVVEIVANELSSVGILVPLIAIVDGGRAMTRVAGIDNGWARAAISVGIAGQTVAEVSTASIVVAA